MQDMLAAGDPDGAGRFVPHAGQFIQPRLDFVQPIADRIKQALSGRG